jgi:hypothetical protein
MRSFYRIGKNTYEKGLSFIWILFLESKIENRRISDIMREKQNWIIGSELNTVLSFVIDEKSV